MNEIRTLALMLLDDEQGINRKAYHILSDLLEKSGDTDILDAVCGFENRVYLPENAVEVLREVKSPG